MRLWILNACIVIGNVFSLSGDHYDKNKESVTQQIFVQAMLHHLSVLLQCFLCALPGLRLNGADDDMGRVFGRVQRDHPQDFAKDPLRLLAYCLYGVVADNPAYQRAA